MVRDFVAQLDELLMLETPRFEAAYRALRDAYHPLEIRPAALEGRSYPAEPEALRAFLDAHVAGGREDARRREPADRVADRARRVRCSRRTSTRAAPARRSRAPTSRWAINRRSRSRFVVFGTGHSLLGDLVALTRKHFDTPLGRVTCDTAFVDRIADRLGEAAYHGELAHREEHSIEFQALYLKHRLGDRPFTIVPILCGGFHQLLDEQRTPREDLTIETLIDAVRETVKALGGATVYVAGVDFSHVGARFGDPRIDERVKQEVEAMDHDAIDGRPPWRRRSVVPVDRRPRRLARGSAASRRPTRCCAAPTSATAGCSTTSSRTRPTARR